VKETRFIEQNKEKWSQFESHLKEPNIDSDELKNIFIQVTDDLSYARTFYSHRSVKVYLNSLSQKFFTHIYKNRNSFWKTFKNFWLEDLPQICYIERKTILVAFIVLSISMVIGSFSALHDKTFVNTILGDSYVSMTKENIAKGKPFNVYADENQFDMFLSIGTNNLRACFITFIFGLLFGIGSLGMLLYMGIEIGAFHTFFYQSSKQLLISSLLTVWLHGTIEIGSLIISAAAGLTLARGMLFPGTFSRWQAFQLSGRRAVKMILGIFPFIIIAAFIESFITRYAETPALIKLLLIVASLVLMLGYFVWYPLRKAKKGFYSGIDDVQLPHSSLGNMAVPSGIQTNSDTLGNTFLLFSKMSRPFTLVSILIAALSTLWFMFFHVLPQHNGENYYYDYSYFTNFESAFDMFLNWSKLGLLQVAYLFILAFMFVMLSYYLKKNWNIAVPSFGKYVIKKIVWILPAVVLVNLVLLIPSWWKLLAIVVEYPLLFIWCFIICFEEIKFVESFQLAWKYYWGSIVKNVGLNLIIVAMILSLFLILGNPYSSNILFGYYKEIIEWNISLSSDALSKIYFSTQFFITCFISLLSIAIWFIGNAIQYFSLREIHKAVDLEKRVQEIGASK
jgi:uncharacterized membrane protein SpoIIM required for sporulation